MTGYSRFINHAPEAVAELVSSRGEASGFRVRGLGTPEYMTVATHAPYRCWGHSPIKTTVDIETSTGLA